MPVLVFVGGASGVGKTTLCKELVVVNSCFDYLSFFKSMRTEAGNDNKEERLQRWGELQLLVVANQISPRIKSGKSIVFDTHFAFQRSGGPEIAFAKRGFNPDLNYQETFSDEFFCLLGNLSVSVLSLFLEEDETVILERQRTDVKALRSLSQEIVRKEQVAEKKCWIKFCSALAAYKILYLRQRIINSAPVDTTVKYLSELLEQIPPKVGK